MIDYFCGVCEGWITDYDIDGIRFDVGNEVSHRFLKKIREHLKRCKEDIYLLGEIWHDASQWLMGDEYDSVMNYPLMSGIHDFFLDKGMKKEEFEYMINRCYTMYMQQNNNVMFNLLDSHDTERLMNRFSRSGYVLPAACRALYHAGKSLYLLWYRDRHGGRTRSGLQKMYAMG